MVQLPPGATEFGQLLVCAKSFASMPPSPTLTVTLTVLLFLKVAVIGELVFPTVTVPKFKLVGDKLIAELPYPMK